VVWLNGELEMTYKEAAMTCFAVLYQHSSRDTDKNNETSYSGKSFSWSKSVTFGPQLEEWTGNAKIACI
jgi:hypothetical protein